MKQKRRGLWPLLYGTVLVLFTAYVLLDTFVTPRRYAAVESTSSSGTTTAVSSEIGQTTPAAKTTVTADSYDDGTVSIKITTYRVDNTSVYVADVTLSDPSALQTAFAQGTFGKNITQTTSSIAQSAGAILAINDDYYSARSGYVIRNGVLYRSTSAGNSQEDLVIYADGTFDIVTEGETSAEALLAAGAQQVLSFGPGLMEDGQVAVTANEEVDQAMTNNPRTAIGMISPLHYVLVVADGRTTQSTGLSLYQLASFMQELGVQTGYNLDGGGSSTMVFNGTVINQPTTNGKTIAERKVSDIVCIG